ncbi:monocarboxylate transporter 2-like [Anneissia japonica]|uniref:monocarboxylate transporter 2-like n=1 Tax=Anneissia japonica TaxID=1529436 RepID=UPI0014256160|nr:monocarboxylate transporter 2-like [Anneissia japonica]
MERTKLMSKYKQVGIIIGLFINAVLASAVLRVIFGIFQPILIDNFENDSVTMVGTLTISVNEICGIVGGVIVDKIGKSRAMFIGGILCFLGFFISAFSTNIFQLAVGHGFLLPIGIILAYHARMLCLNEFFGNRFLLTSNLVTLGSPVGVMSSPTFAEILILSYGFQGAYLILSGIMFHICVSATLCRTKHADIGIPTYNLINNSTAEAEIPNGFCDTWFTTVSESIKFYELKETGGYFSFIIGFALALSGYLTSLIYLSPFAIEENFTPEVAATFVSVLGFSDLVARLMILFCDMYYTMEWALISLFLYSLGVCSILSILVFISPTKIVFIMYAFGTGFGGAILLLGYPVIVRNLCKHRNLGVAIGWGLTLLGLCSLMVGFIYSWLCSYFGNYRFGFLCGAILYATALLIISSSSSLRQMNCLLFHLKTWINRSFTLWQSETYDENAIKH